MPLDDAARAWIARWVRLAEGDLAMARLGLENHDLRERLRQQRGGEES